MASDDDVQIQLGIDLSSLHAEAKKAADVISAALSESMGGIMSGKVLGGGGAAGDAGGASTNALLSQILAAIQGTNSTLQHGQLAAATPAGAGGSGTGGANLGAAPSRDRETPFGSFGKALSTGSISGMIGTAMGGGPGMGVLHGAGNIGRQLNGATETLIDAMNSSRTSDHISTAAKFVDMIPGMGGWSSGLESWAKRTGRVEDVHNLMLGQARAFGSESLQEYQETPWASNLKPWLEEQGMTLDDYVRARQVTGVRAGDSGANTTRDILSFDKQYGMNSSADLIGAMRRTGNNDDSTEVLGTAIGIAIATNLDAGRFGEAVSAMAKSAGAVQFGVADLGRIASMQLFVSQMGPAYAPGSAAHAGATGMLQNVGAGQTGDTAKAFALQAEMERNGGDYFAAEVAMARGAKTKGGLDPEATLAKFQSIIQPLVDAGETDKAASMLSKLNPGTNTAYWKDYLTARALGHSPAGQLGKHFIDKAKAGLNPVLPSVLRQVEDKAVKGSIKDFNIDNEDSWFFNTKSSGLDEASLDGRQGDAAQARSISQIAAEMSLPESAIAAQAASSASGNYANPAYGSNAADTRVASALGQAKTGDDHADWLRDGHRESTEFGGRGGEHDGADRGYPGMAVHAPFDGSIISMNVVATDKYKKKHGVKNSHAYGISINIRSTGKVHNDKLKVGRQRTVKLMHIDQETVPKHLKVGSPVKKGEFLGRIVNTKSFKKGGGAPHLHVEMYKDNGYGNMEAVDPFKGDAASLTDAETMDMYGGKELFDAVKSGKASANSVDAGAAQGPEDIDNDTKLENAKQTKGGKTSRATTRKGAAPAAVTVGSVRVIVEDNRTSVVANRSSSKPRNS